MKAYYDLSNPNVVEHVLSELQTMLAITMAVHATINRQYDTIKQLYNDIYKTSKWEQMKENLLECVRAQLSANDKKRIADESLFERVKHIFKPRTCSTRYMIFSVPTFTIDTTYPLPNNVNRCYDLCLHLKHHSERGTLRFIDEWKAIGVFQQLFESLRNANDGSDHIKQLNDIIELINSPYIECELDHATIMGIKNTHKSLRCLKFNLANREFNFNAKVTEVQNLFGIDTTTMETT